MASYTCQSANKLWGTTAAPIKGDPKYMYDDPVQGGQNNCSLIASLSSVAWVMYGVRLICIYLNTNTDKSKNYNVKFWTGPPPKPFNWPCKDVFPLDTLENQPYQNAHSRDKYEIWPALYEQAYASKYHGAGNNPCPLNNVAWDPNPINLLNNLTGCTVHSITDPTKFDYFTEIKNRCASGKTLYPMAIWTKSQNKLPVGYDGAIRPDHTYSVLGHWTKDSTDYIVLRDPKGESLQSPTSPNCLLSGSWPISDHFKVYCDTSSRSWGGNHTVTLGNGKFALKSSKIEDYFVAFAWAGP